MSDYGDDDYSDSGEWLYIEDEYLPADDLAEHAIGSPPWLPMDDGYESEELDRYEYFLDLEYGSDGNDENTNYYTHKPQTGNEKTGEKRKRAVPRGGKKKKKQKADDGLPPLDPSKPTYPPVVWRAQADRDVKPKMLEENTDTEPFALMKDWRERLPELPAWPAVSSHKDSLVPEAPTSDESKLAKVSTPISPSEEDEEVDAGGAGVGEAALMAALQKNLAAAGGPLSGMDPQQLLQFAMRMMNDQDAGDDIAGELADDLLARGQDDADEADSEEVPADLMDWLSKNRAPTDSTPSTSTPVAKVAVKRPPTPPSSEAPRGYIPSEDAEQKYAPSTKASKQNTESTDTKNEVSTKRKRNPSEDDAVFSEIGAAATIEGGLPAPKKRATRSTRTFDAPTAASRAKAAPVPAAPASKGRSTRSTRRS